MQVGYSDSGLIAGYRRLLDVRSAKNIYRRRSWVYDTVGHAPLAIDWLLDVRRCTVECLFVTACSMDQYAKEKRTEKHLIVRSGISEAETTNNKRLRFCIEAIRIRSIVRLFCDSRASCSHFWERMFLWSHRCHFWISAMCVYSIWLRSHFLHSISSKKYIAVPRQWVTRFKVTSCLSTCISWVTTY